MSPRAGELVVQALAWFYLLLFAAIAFGPVIYDVVRRRRSK